ncbi:hypothetical protein L228DRAFT_100017 [Xylona heveae TC161]|uniref:Uncharacterized protein n=1 Tax=Xylona heveae (strain CBS 132557 / TC161) TaxID=1328760 RepID=A0A165I9Z7_XYLHT|nr:hypothetical protein L228DRAFT_100017 [Xylona heveae TC161]KZF24604.1 hypothetical protein L228DRAFT_100017 [Xylona heveae TC161]
MRRILRRSACVNGRPNVNYPPIAFALGWHVGTVALLDAGADPLPIIPQVIKRKDDDSLQLIFTYNFLDRFEGSREALLFSILWFALEYRATDKAVDLIADKILSGAQICQKVSRSPVNLPLLPKDHRLQYYYNSACQKGNTVYHDRSVNKIAAEKLFNVGLNVIDGVNEVGDTPLSMWCRMAFIIDQIPPREEELMLFYINKGASLVFESKIAPRSLLHAMAVSLVLRNFKLGSDFVRIAEEIAKHYPQGHCAILTDGCVCYCSTGGCIPTTLLLKSFCIEVWQQDFESSHNENVTAILDWTRLFGLTQSQKEVCFEEYSRLDVFERLGMAHTCCTYRHPGLKEKGLSCDEQVELREEDNPLNEVLTIYMQTYRRARNDYHGTSEAFWEAWTEVVNEYLPPIKTRHGRKFNIYSRAIDELESSIPVSGVSEASNQQGTFIEDAEKVYDRLKSILHLDDEAGAMYNMGQAVDHVL